MILIVSDRLISHRGRRHFLNLNGSSNGTFVLISLYVMINDIDPCIAYLTRTTRAIAVPPTRTNPRLVRARSFRCGHRYSYHLGVCLGSLCSCSRVSPPRCPTPGPSSFRVGLDRCKGDSELERLSTSATLGGEWACGLLFSGSCTDVPEKHRVEGLLLGSPVRTCTCDQEVSAVTFCSEIYRTEP